MLPPFRSRSLRRAPGLTRNQPTGDRAVAFLATVVGALALVSCQSQAPPAAGPPPEPPSGAIRIDEPIPCAALAEHLRFNTRSRMQLMQLEGQVVQVRGPVSKVEPDGAGAVVHLGSERDSCVRAHFADAADLKGVRPGEEVDVVGTFAFRGDYVLLEAPRLGGDKGLRLRLVH